MMIILQESAAVGLHVWLHGYLFIYFRMQIGLGPCPRPREENAFWVGLSGWFQFQDGT